MSHERRNNGAEVKQKWVINYSNQACNWTHDAEFTGTEQCVKRHATKTMDALGNVSICLIHGDNMPIADKQYASGRWRDLRNK